MHSSNPGPLNPDHRRPNLYQASPSKPTHLGCVGRHCGIRFASLLLAAITAFLAGALPLQAQTDPDSNTRVTVLVYNFVNVPQGVLQAAERQADLILGEAGAKVDWVPCPKVNAPDSQEPCRTGWSIQTPGLRIVAGASKFQEAQFGSTAIPIYSTVYYDRVTARAHRDHTDADLSVMLGCVIAHELGHLLLRSPGHDPRGIMQAQWGSSQLRQALTGHLLFTKDQAIRIQSQARILASIPRATQPTITP